MGQNRATGRSHHQQGTRLNLGEPQNATADRAMSILSGFILQRSLPGCALQIVARVAARWITRQKPKAPDRSGAFLSIKCLRPHTELQVGTLETFPRLGLQAIAIR
jgi:hypothetical protein